MPRYFFTSLAGRPMRLSGRVITFKICGIAGGRASGVYEATDEGEIAVLADAVQGRRGVSEISADEFAKAQKKTIPSSKNFNVSPPRVVQIPQLPQLAVEAAPGVVSMGRYADGSQKPPEDLPPAPAPSISSLLRVKRVNPPKPFSAADDKIKTATIRADRAKIRMVRKNIGTAADPAIYR